MKKLIFAVILALAFVLPASADLRIATIDTGKAFDAYYKTKEMAVRIAAKKASFEREIQDLQAEYENSRQEAQSLENAVKDTSTPLDVRKSKDTALAEKVQDLQSMEREIDQMRQQRSKELRDELVRSHQEISDEIMRVITAYVAPQGYDLIFDRAKAGPAEASLFPYNSGKVFDLTEVIISRLNASAPPSK